MRSTWILRWAWSPINIKSNALHYENIHISHVKSQIARCKWNMTVLVLEILTFASHCFFQLSHLILWQFMITLIFGDAPLKCYIIPIDIHKRSDYILILIESRRVLGRVENIREFWEWYNWNPMYAVGNDIHGPTYEKELGNWEFTSWDPITRKVI